MYLDEIAAFSQHDIPGLQVSMNYAVFVQEVNRQGDLKLSSIIERGAIEIDAEEKQNITECLHIVSGESYSVT
jgi:predicted mannosyl-3-phosphoglycerate phosphatase (HAD superfamily)